MSIRIKERISDYETLGVFLLNDDTGVILHRIKNDFKRSDEILDEIFDRWIRGEGQIAREKTNSWGKLVKYLQIAKLLVLADEIESVLEFCAENSVKSNNNCLVANHISVHEAPWFYLACILTAMTIISTIIIITKFRNKCKISIINHNQNVCLGAKENTDIP